MTDYATALAPDTVRIERTFPGPIERVWAYLDGIRQAREMAGERRYGPARRRQRPAHLAQFRPLAAPGNAAGEVFLGRIR